MAFGSSRRGGGSGSSDVGVVRLVADTGQANASISEFERNTLEAYRSVSREALKLEVAQERVERSVKRNGVESSRTKAAVLALKDAEEAAARATDRLGREHAQASSQADRHRRSMVGLAGSVGGLTALFGGAYGVVSVLRASVKEAREAESVNAQLGNAVRRVGQDYAEHRKQIELTLQAQAKMSSFDDEDLGRTFTLFARRTKDVNEALRLNALAANVARGRNIELEAAAQLVLKASLGQVGGLRRAGIEIGKNASATEALTRLQQSYGQSAATFAATSEGVQQRFNKVLGDTKEIIGTSVLPVVNEYLSKGADWLEQMNESGELQKKVNGILEDAGDVVRGFAGAVRTVKSVVDPLVSAVGGLDDAVRLLLIGMAVSKLVGFAGALRGVAGAATAARTQIGLLNRTPVAPGGTVLGPMGKGARGAPVLNIPGALPFIPVGMGGEVGKTSIARDGSGGFVLLGPDGQRLQSVSESTARKFAPGLFAGKAALPVDFSARGLTPTSSTTTAGGFAQMGGATPQSTTPVGAATSSSSFALQLARATTDQQRLQLLLRQRGFLERGVARFQGKGMGQAELRFRNELDTVQGQITGIFASRNEARDARQQSIDEAAATRRAKDEADKAERIATRDANRQERTATQDARIGFLKTKAGLTPTLKDDISAGSAELRLLRRRISQVKPETAAWYELKSAEATLAAAQSQLLDQREANVRKAEDKARTARIMKAAKALGITYGGPGAGGPAGQSDRADSPLAAFQRASFQFLGQLQGATNQYGSNYSGGVGKVEVHQHFPHPPNDQHSLAIWTQHAIERTGMVG